MGASTGRAAVVCIGSATYDFIAVVQEPIAPDVRLAAQEMLQGAGGPAATAAVALARLGVPVSFVGAVGDDELGQRIREGLEEAGVEASGLHVVPGARSASSVIVIDSATGRRAIAAFAGASPAPELRQEDLERCAAARWVHVDQAGYPVLAALRAAGLQTPISLDAGNPIPGLELRHIALYSPTETALKATFDTEDSQEALHRALEAGARTVVVTRGAEGSLAAQAEPGAAGGVRVHSAPVPDVGTIRSTLGAGDVFHGALLAALCQERPLSEALRYANATAALSCRALDGRSGIPAAAEVEELLSR
jgi:sugar/nucleoside kinase (ribokinase family)